MVREVFSGGRCYCCYAAETGYGTGGSPIAGNYFGKINSFVLDMEEQRIFSQGVGEGRNYTSAKNGNFILSGSISGEVIDFTPLQYAIGDIQGSGTSGAPYELVEQDALDYTNGLKTLHLEVGHVGVTNSSVFDLTGIFLNTLTLSGQVGRPLMFNTAFIGQTTTKSTSALTYTTPVLKPFICNTLQITDGTNAINVVNFNWTIENNSNALYEVNGSRFSSWIGIGVRRYRWSYTLLYDYNDAASTLSAIELLEYFFGASGANTPIAATVDPTALTLKLAISEGVATGDRTASIDLENCFVTNWSHPINWDDDKVQVTVSGIGFAGLSDSTDKVPIRFYTS